jgi:hypothetical protein
MYTITIADPIRHVLVLVPIIGTTVFAGSLVDSTTGRAAVTINVVLNETLNEDLDSVKVDGNAAEKLDRNFFDLGLVTAKAWR